MWDAGSEHANISKDHGHVFNSPAVYLSATAIFRLPSHYARKTLSTPQLGSDLSTGGTNDATINKAMNMENMQSAPINRTSLISSTNSTPLVSSENKVQKEASQSRLGDNIFENRRLFTVKQAAIYLSCDKETVYDVVAVGRIPHIPFGKRGIRIDRKDLDRYVEKNKKTKKKRVRRTKDQIAEDIN